MARPENTIDERQARLEDLIERVRAEKRRLIEGRQQIRHALEAVYDTMPEVGEKLPPNKIN
jgi:hypothetical protein